MKLGIVGLPNVGKSTIYNALTKAGAMAANYPFCTIDPNIGSVAVPDERVDQIYKMFTPEKKTYAHIDFYDIAGLVKGASKGEGLGNKFLSHIRETDAILHVVRCFDDKDVIHVNGKTDPIYDIEVINTELILADIEAVDKAIIRSMKSSKADPKKHHAETEIYMDLKNHLNQGNPARSYSRLNELPKNELFLLTEKPVIYIANIDEDSVLSKNRHVDELVKHALSENAKYIKICAKLEEESLLLDEEQRNEFLLLSGIETSAIYNIIKESYELLNYISFITFNNKEVRAWPVKKGTHAKEAAGKVHTDFEKGFIRAETISYEELIKCGSIHTAKEKGILRSEGKEYMISDGDIILFRYNL